MALVNAIKYSKTKPAKRSERNATAVAGGERSAAELIATEQMVDFLGASIKRKRSWTYLNASNGGVRNFTGVATSSLRWVSTDAPKTDHSAQAICPFWCSQLDHRSRHTTAAVPHVRRTSRNSSITSGKRRSPESPTLNTDDQTLAVYQFDEGRGETLSDPSGNHRHGEIRGAKWTNDSAIRHRAGPGLVGFHRHAVDVLTEALKDQNPEVRLEAATALGTIGKNATSAVLLVK